MTESAGWQARVHGLETALTEVRGELAAQKDHNARLISTLREAREQIVTLKAAVTIAPEAGEITVDFTGKIDGVAFDGGGGGTIDRPLSTARPRSGCASPSRRSAAPPCPRTCATRTRAASRRPMA